LEQQQHDREQRFFACDDEQQHGAANDAAAEHHGFRGDVNTATIAAGVDADDTTAREVAINIRRQKNVPAPLAPGLSYLNLNEFEPWNSWSAEDRIDPERKGRTGDRLYRLKFNSRQFIADVGE
jgi:hypothetical protein